MGQGNLRMILFECLLASNYFLGFGVLFGIQHFRSLMYISSLKHKLSFSYSALPDEKLATSVFKI